MAEAPIASTSKDGFSSEASPFTSPQISLPKGGGAIRGIGEKFAANPVTGTGSLTVPIAVSPGRSGFGPELSLSYDSGLGNGPFGIGWSLSLPTVLDTILLALAPVLPARIPAAHKGDMGGYAIFGTHPKTGRRWYPTAGWYRRSASWASSRCTG